MYLYLQFHRYRSEVLSHLHHVPLSTLISLTLPRHTPLSSIASGRSSGLHPVSVGGCFMKLRAGWHDFARSCVGVHRSTLLLPQRCPACMVCLTLIVFVVGGRTVAALWGAASRTCPILLALITKCFTRNL